MKRLLLALLLGVVGCSKNCSSSVEYNIVIYNCTCPDSDCSEPSATSWITSLGLSDFMA